MADANEPKVVRRRRKRRSVFSVRKRKKTSLIRLDTTENLEAVENHEEEVASTSQSASQADCCVADLATSADLSVSSVNASVNSETQLNSETVTNEVTSVPSVRNNGEEPSADTVVQGVCAEETLRTAETSANSADKEGSERRELECPICLEPCVLPSKLPCSHVFCFLCIKGTTCQRGQCPMCRADIPHHYTINPELMPSTSITCQETQINAPQEEKLTWFYEGRRGGWWEFESRMSEIIEENQSEGVNRFEMMICGELYVIDTQLYIQYPKDYPRRTRKLLRDLPSRVHRKGVAGIHAHSLPSTSSHSKH